MDEKLLPSSVKGHDEVDNLHGLKVWQWKEGGGRLLRLCGAGWSGGWTFFYLFYFAGLGRAAAAGSRVTEVSREWTRLLDQWVIARVVTHLT